MSNTISLSQLADSDLYKIIGITVNIKLANRDDIITGMIFSIIKESKLLILLAQENAIMNSYIVNIEEITEITMSEIQFDIDCKDVLSFNLEKLLENERHNLEKDNLLKKAELDKDNTETKLMYQKGYYIYEKLSKLYKCTYDGNKILLDEIDSFIEEPFNVDNLYCEDEYTKKRLIKLIESSLKSI